MEYEFNPTKLKNKYEDESYMKKHYNDAITRGMLLFLQALEASENAYDLKTKPFFYMEHKKGNLKEYYSISLDKKKSKWRLLIKMLDEDGNVIIPTNDEKSFLKSVKKIRIERLSDHYGEY